MSPGPTAVVIIISFVAGIGIGSLATPNRPSVTACQRFVDFAIAKSLSEIRKRHEINEGH